MLALGVAALATGGCSTTPPGATDPNLALAKSRAAQGGDAFGEQCAGCHGARGEGTTKGPVIIGGGALPTYPRSGTSDNLTTDPNELQLRTQSQVPGAPKRQPFNTARDVYDYVSTKMPAGRPGSLPADDYWQIVSFMLVAHGRQVPDEGLSRANAASVAIQPN